MFADKHLNGYSFDSYDDKMTTKTMGLMSFMGPLLSEAGAGANAAKSALTKTAVNTTTEFVEEAIVHGNSLKSLKPTWGYKLYSQDGTFLKNGITNKFNPQSRYTRSFMKGKYIEPYERFPNRLEAYQWEFQQNLIQRGPLNLNMH